jgi:hypothetical protein
LTRQEKSRQELDDKVARVLQNYESSDTTVLGQWELNYEKECFFKAISYLSGLDHKSLKSSQGVTKPKPLAEGDYIGHAIADIEEILEKRDLTLRDAEIIAINHTTNLPRILREIAQSYKIDFEKGIICAAEVRKV